MARSYRYLHYDVFTDHLFGGNQLAVVLDGRGLTTATMQAIAKEMNFRRDDVRAAGRAARTPTSACGSSRPPPSCRSPAIRPSATHVRARATPASSPNGREQFVFGLGVGPVPVALTWRGGDLRFAWMTQGTAAFAEPTRRSRRRRGGTLAAGDRARGQSAGAGGVVRRSVSVRRAEHACRRRRGVRCSSVHSRRCCSQPAQVRTACSSFRRRAGPADAGPTQPDGVQPHVRARAWRGRGSGDGHRERTAGLATWSVTRSSRRESAGALLSLQGVRMGRPSHVHISIGVDGDAITSVQVGGESVLAGEGLLYI